MRNTRIIFQIFVMLVFLTLNNNVFATNDIIQIDRTNKRLVAPQGEGYQWYYNGLLINGLQDQYMNDVKSGEYKVSFINESGKQCTEIIRVAVQQGVIQKIYVIGDSTVQTYNSSYYPQEGWGQVLQLFFDNSKYQVVNKAIGGRSSRTFYEEGRWTEVTNLLAAGDYVFIQFGHNDRDYSKPARYTDTAAYKYYLRIYVNETRAKGAVPVLVSPMIMNAYNGTTLRNVFTEGANDYRGSMLKVAQELNAPFVDLNMKSYDRIKEVGQEYATYFLFLGLLSGEYTNFPSGSSDGTHFQEMGALEMAGLIREGINELSADTNMTDLITALLPTYQVNVSMNKEDAGIVTQSGNYPAGAQVTLKTRLKSNNYFSRWEDDSANLVSTSKLYKFTMKAQDTGFVAIITDCNGDIDGTATVDKCGYCSGGNTGRLYCLAQFQSESACVYDGVIENETVNNIAMSYINTGAQENGGFSYMLSSLYDTSYTLGIVYKSTNANEKINILLNEEIKKTIPVETINTWDTIYFSLDVTKGKYHFRVESDQTTGGIMFDNLMLSNYGLLKASCDPLDISELNKLSYNVYPNPFHHTFYLQGEDQMEFSVYNYLGILVETGICQGKCEIGDKLDKGIYIMHIKNKNKSTSLMIRKD